MYFNDPNRFFNFRYSLKDYVYQKLPKSEPYDSWIKNLGFFVENVFHLYYSLQMNVLMLLDLSIFLQG